MDLIIFKNVVGGMLSRVGRDPLAATGQIKLGGKIHRANAGEGEKRGGVKSKLCCGPNGAVSCIKNTVHSSPGKHTLGGRKSRRFGKRARE